MTTPTDSDPEVVAGHLAALEHIGTISRGAVLHLRLPAAARMTPFALDQLREAIASEVGHDEFTVVITNPEVELEVEDPPPMAPQTILTAHAGAALSLLAEQMVANSRRWFPDAHAQGDDYALLHFASGIVGEAAEAAQAVKKFTRDGHTPLAHQHLANELADVFTYLLEIAGTANVDLIEGYRRKLAECEQRWG